MEHNSGLNYKDKPSTKHNIDNFAETSSSDDVSTISTLSLPASVNVKIRDSNRANQIINNFIYKITQPPQISSAPFLVEEPLLEEPSEILTLCTQKSSNFYCKQTYPQEEAITEEESDDSFASKYFFRRLLIGAYTNLENILLSTDFGSATNDISTSSQHNTENIKAPCDSDVYLPRNIIKPTFGEINLTESLDLSNKSCIRKKSDIPCRIVPTRDKNCDSNISDSSDHVIQSFLSKSVVASHDSQPSTSFALPETRLSKNYDAEESTDLSVCDIRSFSTKSIGASNESQPSTSFALPETRLSKNFDVEGSTDSSDCDIRSFLTKSVGASNESQASTSFALPETRLSKNDDVEGSINNVTRMQNLINDIVQPLTLSSLSHIFESAKNTTAYMNDAELLMISYKALLQIIITALDNNQNLMSDKILQSGKIRQAWKSNIVKLYLKHHNGPSITVAPNKCNSRNQTSKIRGKSEMTLRLRSNISYREEPDSDTTLQKHRNANIKKIKAKRQIRSKKRQIRSKKCLQKDQVEIKKQNLPTDFSAKNGKTSDENLSGVSINDNIIRPIDSIDELVHDKFFPVSSLRNQRSAAPPSLSTLKHDCSLFRRRIMQDFKNQKRSEKKIRKIKKTSKKFKAKKVDREPIKLKFSRFFLGFDSLTEGGKELLPDASVQWTYKVCRVGRK